MDLISGQPWWFYKNGISNAYPSLTQNTKEEVVIMGGGITGALLAWHLTRAGFPVIVLEKRHIGMGSTSGSTALLQYEIDTMLTDLIGMIGEKNAVRSYQLCVEAIYKVQLICKKLKVKTDFALQKSIYYASVLKDRDILRKEFEARKKMGIDVEWWDRETIRKNIPDLNKSAAILSHDGAQIDAYQFTHFLLQDCISKGARVYDTVEVTEIKHHSRGVTLMLDNGFKLDTKKLVIASGYESQNYLSKRVVRLHSSYAIISKPIDNQKELWYENAMLWESARPYLYMRTTADKRMLIGGKDEMFSSAVKRDKLLHKKSLQLENNAKKIFPHLPFVTDYSWCGTFAETEDGLPFIGSVKEHPDTYFALGFGGNGILFSILAAEIITDLMQGKKNRDAEIFKFDRI
ncbi:Gamma-glutamylputrescine oxidoreductase [Dyadobacter sp. CECT 9275]|uniref:Gamma-glutamylputrescine oxidoreductase n=1 Tax=Dyadobacter helix TaxID=2822344 RepID=A0A916JFS5_9BACT|nr:FAD-dependent oxidoreductase [Dyadobacter sp. CECT 9275]CAG5007498.1 Gamma-glutamylputrescine oxidoreductase [Dyadobacter sp. CECT 9275]